MKKKQIMIAGGIIILIIVVFLVISRSRGGSEGEEVEEAVSSQPKVVVYEKSASGGDVSIEIPFLEEGDDVAKLDESLAKAVGKLQGEEADTSITGGFKVRLSGDSVNYIFTLDSSAGESEVVTFVLGGKESIDVEAYLVDTVRLTKISSHIKNTLTSRFPKTERSVISEITAPLSENFSNYRVADNGVVFMFSQEKLDGRTAPLYHEVLVPSEVISMF